MTQEEKIKQAVHEGNIDYCHECKKKQPIELTFFNPDEDGTEDFIQCLICGNGIRFI